ncbi:MAG TPA: hypothetical protein DCP08_00135 [Chloroflexi bacterium]|nr:hypothetical protein [Chloroflexota bacterium]
MVDEGFLARVRELGVHERAVRAPSQLKSERTRVFTSLERLLAFLEGLPAEVEVEVARKRDRYVLYIRR